jgi:hypothetical protein
MKNWTEEHWTLAFIVIIGVALFMKLCHAGLMSEHAKAFDLKKYPIGVSTEVEMESFGSGYPSDVWTGPAVAPWYNPPKHTLQEPIPLGNWYTPPQGY